MAIKEGNETTTIKKDQLIWMLENNKIHVNTDLRQRFVPRRTINIETAENAEDIVWKSEKVSKGDYVVFVDDEKLFFGRVLNFKILNKRSKKDSIFYKDFVKMDSSENIGFFLNPLYSIEDGNKEVKNIFRYFEVKSYKCHAKFDVDFTQENVINFIAPHDDEI